MTAQRKAEELKDYISNCSEKELEDVYDTINKNQSTLDAPEACLIGQDTLVFCLNYIYCGILRQVTENYLVLDDPYIVYETGEFSYPKYEDAQRMCSPSVIIRRSSIESISLGKNI